MFNFLHLLMLVCVSFFPFFKLNYKETFHVMFNFSSVFNFVAQSIYQAVVIEGTYWKRRMANITAEYQKWRLFYRDRFRMKPSPEADNVCLSA